MNEQFSQLTHRLDRLEDAVNELSGRTSILSSRTETDLAPKDRVGRLEDQLVRLERVVSEVDKRARRMRFDQQIKFFPEWVRIRSKKKRNKNEGTTRPLSKKKEPIVVICPVYPGGERAYGGEFIEKRALLYKSAGYEVIVCEVSKRAREQNIAEQQGITVYRTSTDDLSNLLESLSPRVLCVHQLEKYVWDVIRAKTSSISTIVWIHGFEARDWRELAFNFSPEDLERNRNALDQANAERKETMSQLFNEKKVVKIFVSEFMLDVASKFAGRNPKNAQVIHNVIPNEIFSYDQKPDDLRIQSTLGA